MKKKNRVALLLHWAGGHKFWLFLSVLLSLVSGLCTMVPYIGIYQLMDAGFAGTCTKELVMQSGHGRCGSHAALRLIRQLRRCIPQRGLWGLV